MDRLVKCLVSVGWEQWYFCQSAQKEEAIWQINHSELQTKGQT